MIPVEYFYYIVLGVLLVGSSALLLNNGLWAAITDEWVYLFHIDDKSEELGK